MVPVVALVVLVVRWVAERKPFWRAPSAAVLGMALAWLVRPDPVGSARTVYVHLVELALAKQRHVPLAFGNEVYRLPNADLIDHYLPFLILWLAATAALLAAILIRKSVSLTGAQRTRIFASLVLSVIFFQLSSSATIRGVDPWVVFGAYFMGAACSALLAAREGRREAAVRRRAKVGTGTLAAALIVVLAWTATTRSFAAIRAMGIDPHRCAPAMRWLDSHSSPGSIVFHTSWSLFPEMFFWDKRNRYLNGMDPIFLYAYDRSLYWKVHRLAVGASAANTSGSPPGEAEKPVDTFTVLTRDFDASYLLLERSENPELFAYAASDHRFALRYDSGGIAIFSLGGR